MEENLICQSKKNKIIAVSSRIVSKVFLIQNEVGYIKELRALFYSNKVNNLVVKYQSHDAESGSKRILLERLFSISLESISLNELEIFFINFERELSQLHQSGFVHNDLNNNSYFVKSTLAADDSNSNIILTAYGFRLIDTECSELLREIGKSKFEQMVKREMDNFNSYKQMILNLRKNAPIYRKHVTGPYKPN